MGQTAKNNLGELNNILFNQLRKLSAAQTKEEMKQEIDRSGAICSVAGQITAGASLALRATCIAGQIKVPDMLQIEDNPAVNCGGLD